ncbi:MAG: Conserved hypothetical periplasmic protein [Bacteroidetes bacterium]|nr:Conserved hypothetical periplasmic protein [Bacteroidota bacterium]
MKLLLRSVLPFIFFSILYPAAVSAQTKQYPSLLWEITGNGLTKPSYLYGTMHVSKKVAFHLSDAFFDDLKSVDIVALESNPETWLSELMSESTSMLTNSYFRNYFGKNASGFYDKAFDFTIPSNKYLKNQIAVEPENVNGLLYRFNGSSSENFEEYTYLDLFIFQSARKSGKDVLALENFRASMEMLVKASMPDEDKSTQIKHKAPSYHIGEQIEDAYRNADLDALDSLNKYSYTSKNFEKYMIVDRNVIMANHMDSIMKKQSLFTAIGAAHLPGNDGVISLLRKMGYTVKPVISNVSKKSIKTMDQLEEAHTPLVFTTQYASDSSFQVDAPGHLFAMVGFDPIDTYLYTDMVNGSYYLVKRIHTYGVLKGQDAAYQQRRVDSILYESIPGKIMHKEAIKANNGDPGFDIVNKTRRGDLQRYRIYVSPEYITIFRVAGDDDYIEKSDVDKFFKSITFKTVTGKGSWATYTPAYGGYQVKLPSGYTAVKPGASQYQKERITASEGADFYMVGRSVLNDNYYIEEDTFELSQLAKNFYESLDFQLQSKQFITYASFPGIDVNAKKKNSDNYIHLRIVLKDQQYFLLSCINTKKEMPDNFFSSLKFMDFKHEKMETYTDTSLYFSVKTDYTEAKKSFMQSLADPESYYYAKLMKKPAAYNNWTRDKTVESPTTSEAVDVEVMKCSDYRMDKSPDEFWKTRTDYYKYNTSLRIKEQKRYDKNGMQVMDLMLCDTNSIREIKTRMILNNGLLYTLNTTIDSVTGPGEWVKTFYETFKPADTVIGRSIFENKVAEFLTAAASKDSTTRDKVNSLYNSIDFENKNAPVLIKFIGGPDFNTAALPLKTYLILQLGELKDPGVVGFLKNQYPKYADSASIQLAILEALSSQKTVEGNSVFLQSLLMDSPLSNSDDDVTDIFTAFYDTLKLAPALFPQLLQITKYDEYKSGIYDLMSTLLDSALIKTTSYEATKKDLLREANDELKRQIASEENSGSNNYQNDYGNYGGDRSGGGDAATEQAIADAMAVAKAAQDYKSSGQSSPDDVLVNYCNLLAPFYTDPAVKNFFGKALKTKSDDFKISLVSILLKNNQVIPDTMIDHLAKDLNTRVDLYTALKKINKLDKMKPEYRSQESLARALLFSGNDIPADSIKLVTSKFVQSKEHSGTVYFYTSTSKDGGRKFLRLIGFQPTDSTKVEMNVVKDLKIVYEKDNIDEMINKACYELSLTGRKRASTYSYGGEDDFSYGDY